MVGIDQIDNRPWPAIVVNTPYGPDAPRESDR